MESTSEIVKDVPNSSSFDSSGVLNRDGVYYAQLALPGEDTPLIVALHGVSSEKQAIQALRSFLGNGEFLPHQPRLQSSQTQ